MKKIALLGYRHIHIADLKKRAENHPRVSFVALCEENPATSLLSSDKATATHQNFESLLREVDFEILGLGDCYGKRGHQAIRALEAGKHILADKPLCTNLAELEKIEQLATSRSLSVGLMLDQRDHGNMIRLREIVRSGQIGEIQTVNVAGQHPLLQGKRPDWYFEPGLHGGTLNDIAIHALDLIPWITGLEFCEVDAARTWNAKAIFAPHFQDCGQFMLRLSNGGGVLGDVSYLAPDTCGYELPQYWRYTLHGTRGMAETSWKTDGVTVVNDSAWKPQLFPPSPTRSGGYLEDFLDEIEGRPRLDGLTTAKILAATRLALELEAKAQLQ